MIANSLSSSDTSSQKSPTLRLAVFDMDGTLIDSQHMIIAAMAAAFASEGMEVPTDTAVRGIIGLSLEDAIATLAPACSAEQVGQMARAYKDAFRDLRTKQGRPEPLYDGVLETIAALQAQDVLLAIATGKSLRGVHAVMEAYQWENVFLNVQTADTNPGKPHPQMLFSAMDALGVQPSECAMIGDTSYDMQMARNARCGAIGVNWGYHSKQELKKAGAHVVLDTYEQVPSAVNAYMTGVL
jgi:phosphoglycolate phosphatase